MTSAFSQTSFFNPQTRIFVAGHRGMVGSAIVRKLEAEGFPIITRTSKELDLTNQQAVRDFFSLEKVDYVVLAAAKVGGIHANNTYPAEFITDNLLIQTNVISEAYRAGIEHLLFLGSSCIYPRSAPQPMREEYLLTGELEPTNEPYAIAKIAGIKMCEAYNRQYKTSYRSVMPTNLYGPGDNYDLENSHVIPAMIRKFHLAKLAAQNDFDGIRRDMETFGPIPEEICEAIGYSSVSGRLEGATRPKVMLWGTGTVYREFLHVDDMAAACMFVMGLNQSVFEKGSSFLNIGTGKDQTIAETASMIDKVVGFGGDMVFDASKPDGTVKKLLDTSNVTALGWQPIFDLETGMKDAYAWYLSRSNQILKLFEYWDDTDIT